MRLAVDDGIEVALKVRIALRGRVVEAMAVELVGTDVSAVGMPVTLWRDRTHVTAAVMRARSAYGP